MNSVIESIGTNKMSAGQRAALELAESSREGWAGRGSFAAGLFMGRCQWGLIESFPAPTSTKGGPFLAQLEELLRTRVDADAIDRTGEIPETVITELAAIGAFGIKIEEEYGGLGLSQMDYCRAAELLGSWCGNTTALLSAHQSIGVPQPLRLFGTAEQKRKYLPRVAGGQISAFALTERGAGSDPARMTTRAEPSADGTHFLLNGEKLWCTNGTRAGLLVVMARTPSMLVDGRERQQITAFIVEMNTPGVSVTHRCQFMGLRALYNAVVRFENVKVPRENILLAEGKGLRVALTTLNTGRLTLPAACTGLSKRCLQIARHWANQREQWGAPIGRHAAIADKLARMAADTYAMESMTLLTAALVDGHDADIRVEAAMCKMFGTEAAWRIVNDTLQIRGGRGFETADSLRARGEEPVAVERFVRDSRINLIFEGSSEIMRLFIAREALDPHLRVAGTIVTGKSALGEKLRAAGFYAGWYPRQWLPARGYLERTSRRLARTMFHQMLRFGPKLEREQLMLGRFVDIGTDLFAMAAVNQRAQSAAERDLARYFCATARRRIAAALAGVRANEDRAGYQLARQILAGDHQWLETGIVGQAGPAAV